MKLRIHGDVHATEDGHMEKFLANISPDGMNLQVGDLNVGFLPMPEFPSNMLFIPGNHDNPDLCRQMKEFVEYGTIWKLGYNAPKVMLIGGALSTDKDLRIEGESWWRNEELSYVELGRMVELYKREKPDIMITHDIMDYAAREMFPKRNDFKYTSRTRQAFQIMIENHSPKKWFFGHYHSDRFQYIGDCMFQCVGELSYTDIEI